MTFWIITECMIAPVDYTNDIRTISSIDNFISINNAIEGSFGQVNSESIGTRHISGSAAQLDFVLGAYLSKGGKSSFVVLPLLKLKAEKSSQEFFLRWRKVRLSPTHAHLFITLSPNMAK